MPIDLPKQHTHALTRSQMACRRAERRRAEQRRDRLLCVRSELRAAPNRCCFAACVMCQFEKYWMTLLAYTRRLELSAFAYLSSRTTEWRCTAQAYSTITADWWKNNAREINERQVQSDPKLRSALRSVCGAVPDQQRPKRVRLRLTSVARGE